MLHKVPDLRILQSLDDLLVANIHTVRDVLPNGSVEEHGMLVDDHNARSQVMNVVVLDRDIVDQDLAIERLVKTLQQLHTRRLSTLKW